MHQRRTPTVAVLMSLAVAGSLLAGCSSSSKPAAATAASGPAVTLNGAGANSIDPFFERVFYDYQHAGSRTTVNYSPAGSSVGVKDIEESTVDFGDSEVPMSATDLAAAKVAILQIPVDLGGVAISYNLPDGPKNLELDGPTLAGIFDGSITTWNASPIAALNPGVSLPSTAIVAVHRADSSGPGYDLDDYLIKTSPDWVTAVKTSKPSKTWPLASVGVGEQLNSGVASYIKETTGAIGFVEYGYALQAGFVNAALKNAAGQFVAPSITGIAAAGAQATDLSASKFNIVDEPGATSYPLANFSWTLLDQKQADATKGQALAKLFTYVVTAGQKAAPSLGYATLPADAVSLAQNTIAELETSTGSPLPSS
jgi:phosphate transport system substrate-binding protein